MSTYWSAPVSDAEAARRAGGRRRYNAWRHFCAVWRRREVARLYLELGGGYGVQAAMARRLGVSQATVSRDMAALWEAAREHDRCPLCGTYVLPDLQEGEATG